MYLHFPMTVFTTKKKFNDLSADDMKCGDLNEAQLKAMGLGNDVSLKVDPYKMEHIYKPGVKISREECAGLMFDEMRELCGLFATGRYSHLIRDMINHFQNGSGRAFRDSDINEAYHDVIIQGRSSNSLAGITLAVNNKIRSRIILEKDTFFAQSIRNEISRKYLPKFSRFEDNYNGMGITIHDIHAQEISIKSLSFTKTGWQANILFKAQDHFGLDQEDISKFKFNSWRFFRLWFVLQRYTGLAYKPFFTDFSTTIKLEGSK